MRVVTGVFKSRAAAERAVLNLRSISVPKDKITVLVPGGTREDLQSVPIGAAEPPGIGKALGGVVGAAVGLAGGLELGAVASAFIPGVGSVIAAGLMGAALLGLAGGSVGAIAGDALENGLTEGLPEDELFVYEDALRKGRTVVLAFSDDEATAESARHVIEAEGAESVDAARQAWWMGLRSAEQEHYSSSRRDFEQDEKFYRLGFEAALHARTRCKEYDQVLAEMANDLEELQQRYPDSDLEEPFRHGYERGRAHYQGLCNKRGNESVASPDH
ncbi:MAG TPA: hypothetical protein VMG63_04865 [Terriglobia bacterium]|jgi:hypothetical protein|nr:hypothetical protein [Terriglobia bacterium]